jgi:hypothetical protein
MTYYRFSTDLGVSVNSSVHFGFRCLIDSCGSGKSFTQHLIINQLFNLSTSPSKPSKVTPYSKSSTYSVTPKLRRPHPPQSPPPPPLSPVDSHLAGARALPFPLDRSRIPSRLRHEEPTSCVSSVMQGWKSAGLWGWRTHQSTLCSPLAVQPTSQAVRTASVVSGRRSRVRGAQRCI